MARRARRSPLAETETTYGVCYCRLRLRVLAMPMLPSDPPTRTHRISSITSFWYTRVFIEKRGAALPTFNSVACYRVGQVRTRIRMCIHTRTRTRTRSVHTCIRTSRRYAAHIRVDCDIRLAVAPVPRMKSRSRSRVRVRDSRA